MWVKKCYFWKLLLFMIVNNYIFDDCNFICNSDFKDYCFTETKTESFHEANMKKHRHSDFHDSLGAIAEEFSEFRSEKE